MEVGGQCHTPAALTPAKTWYLMYRRFGGPQGWFRQLRKPSSPWEFNAWTIQALAKRYTDYATPAHKKSKQNKNYI
jgi:hypothetical protein